jgi:hypothetical protein
VDFQQAWTGPSLFQRNKWMMGYFRQTMAKIPPPREGIFFQQAWIGPSLFPRNKWMIGYFRQAMAKIPPGRVFSPLSLPRFYTCLQSAARRPAQ